MKKEECHNFITTLLEIPSVNNNNNKDKQILLCGTNAYSPECEIRRSSDSFETTSKSISINSYSPYWNTTSLLTKNGEFFYGGPLDLRGIDSSIFKQKEIIPSKSPLASYLDRRIVRSVQYDSNWISADANFVFSFEYNQHVYFLFRETAVEFLNVGKRVYSRIGRVCMDDPGWRESWTTFLKAHTESLYFGTEKEFIRLSVHQCHNYHSKDQCIQSGDPYCGWNEIKMKCIRPPGNNLKDENWIQSDQPTCSPRWSKWFTCSETGLRSSSTNETCKCRKRPCTANSNDQHCFDGYEYEVSNCTRNGE
ncbi:semaphorin-5A-like protein, partial [Euroglyphus maynei]